MKREKYAPDVVDFAYQIITMHEENIQLRYELEHYKEMHETHCKSINGSIKNGEKFIGTILSAALDPKSVINKGHDAIIKAQLEGQAIKI